jgi:hypothetical protein
VELHGLAEKRAVSLRDRRGRCQLSAARRSGLAQTAIVVVVGQAARLPGLGCSCCGCGKRGAGPTIRSTRGHQAAVLSGRGKSGDCDVLVRCRVAGLWVGALMATLRAYGRYSVRSVGPDRGLCSG